MKRITNAEAELHSLLGRSAGRSAFVCAVSQFWLTPATQLDIVVFAESYAGSLHLVLSDDVERASRCDTTSTLTRIAEQLETAVFDLSRPLLLQPVHIPKPWGREIWFTGVEARGVCHFAQNGGTVPIPWLSQICGSLLYGNADSTLVLLKILDPLAEVVFGDLYVELHEKKQEVYVVTHIDKTAWPAGVGGIRFGFNQTKRAQFSDDAAFKTAYLTAVRQYRAVRLEIDTLLDAMRVNAGIALDAAVSVSQQKAWLADVTPQLQTQERALREEMDSFYGHLPLQLGDVIKVPCLVPHSLQHGVRTIEFQTPVYERKILSFAQKVLTQGHWDTEQAMSLSQVTPAMVGELEPVPSASGATVERIVDFDTFEVFRITLEAGKALALDRLSANCAYLEVMTVSGHLSAAGTVLSPSEALLIPHKCLNKTLIASNEAAVAVVACPKTRPLY